MLKLKILTAMLLFFPAISWGLSCEQLNSLYDDQDKHIALANALDNLDDSVPRASLYQLQKLERLLQKQILLDFMTQKKCQFPGSVSSRYESPARDCATKILTRAPQHAACDMSEWKKGWGE